MLQTIEKGLYGDIRGSVKCLAWHEILAGKLITPAEKFFKTGAKHCSHLKIKFISSATINEYIEELTEMWEGTFPLPDMHTTCYLKPIDRYVMKNTCFLKKKMPSTSVEVKPTSLKSKLTRMLY